MSVLDGEPSVAPNEQQQRWIEAAQAAIDPEFLRQLAVESVSIPSPTGEEEPLARWLVDAMSERGIPGQLQSIDQRQANALGRLKGDGTGADLLLYAPIDTLTVGTEDEDLPWVGREIRPDMRPVATEFGDHIVGLGASNPKGHVAAIVAAVDAVHRAGVPLRGDVLIGLGAGGMPTNQRPVSWPGHGNVGQGNGCSFMLEQGFWADYAVIAKPGWAVAWEEVGLCWFEITVHGIFSYVGSRHRMPYRNPIVAAATVISELERWFPAYTERHTDGLVAPQGNIGSIEGGWRRTASLSPAACRMIVDLRISPRTPPNEAKAEFAQAIAEILDRHPQLDISWDMVLAIPGTSTPEQSWIVSAATEAWEHVAGRPHAPILASSGATDANILRSRGIPTARVGMDRIGPDAPIPLDFPAGMNVVDLREARRLVEHLVHTVVNTVTRPVRAVGGVNP
jgi:acetylornithine deacetylase/succinyl-diaminopimelate desuccinylase-like protein